MGWKAPPDIEPLLRLVCLPRFGAQQLKTEQQWRQPRFQQCLTSQCLSSATMCSSLELLDPQANGRQMSCLDRRGLRGRSDLGWLVIEDFAQRAYAVSFMQFGFSLTIESGLVSIQTGHYSCPPAFIDGAS
jgi:hypothetical protein